MKMITKGTLMKLQHSIFTRGRGEEDELKLRFINTIIDHCEDIGVWMSIEEFLNSGFEGMCWVHDINGEIFDACYVDGEFMTTGGYVLVERVTNVMPIHKPEPPK